MSRTTMWSKLLYVASLIAGIVAIVQWYIKFPDVSQLIFGLHLALTILMAAYLHTWMTNKTGSDRDWRANKVEEDKARDKAIDVTRDYMREIEKKVKKLTKEE